jgi:hypothetical protein
MSLLDLPQEILIEILSYNNFPYCMSVCKELTEIEQSLDEIRHTGMNYCDSGTTNVLFNLYYHYETLDTSGIIYSLLEDGVEDMDVNLLCSCLRHVPFNDLLDIANTIIIFNEVDMMLRFLYRKDLDIDKICIDAIEEEASSDMIFAILREGITDVPRILSVAHECMNELVIDYIKILL